MAADRDLVFYLQVYQDFGLANACLARLRMFYPDSRILVLSDGDRDPRYAGFVTRYGVEYTEGERLYTVDQGGRMLHRMLERFMDAPSKVLVKMDTDTRADRRLASLPEEGFLHGHPSNHGCLQGGCIFFPRGVAERLFRSKIFLSPELTDWERSWGTVGTGDTARKILEYRVGKLGLIGFEWVLRWGCLKLGIENRPSEEVHSTWKDEHFNGELKYAFVHPDKYLGASPALRSARRLFLKTRSWAREVKRRLFR